MLRDNRREGYTVPSATLYPFQWNWDSAFVAVGLAAEEPDAARREVETLLAAVRPDGMLPHIVFWEEATGYFPGPDEWGVAFERPPENPTPPAALRGGRAGDASGDADAAGDAPTTIRTSGITQPPMVVPAARRVYEATGDDAFLGRVLPALSRHLSWWDRERSPDADGGLVYSRHPWETGMDDSPAWRDPLAAFDPGDVSYDRADRKSAALAAQRPDDWDYDRYVALVRRGRAADWDEARLRETCPFRVEDALTNAVFARACADLAHLHRRAAAPSAASDARPAGADAREMRDAAVRWRERAAASRAAMRGRLWDPDLGTFVSYDRVGDRPLRVNSVAGLVALYGGAPTPEQFDRLCETLEASFLSREYAAASYVGEGMDPDRYWRGPAWMNTNWLVEAGLRRYDAPVLADRVRGDGRRLVEREGFREYFNPDTGEGRGSDRFSWTAALYLDWTA